jgi:glycosyltransferase domain-containing protein
MKYLRRVLSYYSSYGREFKIIVADSSNEHNVELVCSFDELGITHLLYDSDIFFYKKLLDALRYVKTEYCVICADDDFIIPNGIKQSVEFLESNPDFTVALGYFISFSTEKDFKWFPMYSHKSIILPSSEERLKEHLSNFSQSTFYGVHRTSHLRMAFKEAVEHTDDNTFGELLCAMLDLTYGNMKCLDILYGAREEIKGSDRFKGNDFDDFIRESTYERKYITFRDCLISHLNLNPKDAEKLIDDAMAAFLSYHLKAKKKRENSLRHKIKDILPKWIYGIVSPIYKSLFLQSLTKKIKEYEVILNDDFDNIKDAVQGEEWIETHEMGGETIYIK